MNNIEKQQYINEINQLQQDIQKKNKAIQQSVLTNNSLQSALANIQNEKDNLEKQKDLEIAKLKEEKKKRDVSWSTKFNSQETVIRQMQDTIDSKTEELRITGRELATVKAQYSTHISQLTQNFNAYKEDTQNSINDYQQQIQKLQDNLKQQQYQFNATKQQKEKEITDLTQKLNDAISANKNNSASAQVRIAQLQTELQTKQKEYDDLDKDFTDLGNTTNAASLAQKQQIKNLSDQLLQAKKSLSLEKQRSQQQLSKITSELKRDWQLDKSLLESRLQDKAHKEISAAKHEAQKQILTLQEKYNLLQDELKKEQEKVAQNSQSIAQLTQLQEANKKLQEELEQQKQKEIDDAIKRETTFYTVYNDNRPSINEYALLQLTNFPFKGNYNANNTWMLPPEAWMKKEYIVQIINNRRRISGLPNLNPMQQSAVHPIPANKMKYLSSSRYKNDNRFRIFSLNNFRREIFNNILQRNANDDPGYANCFTVLAYPKGNIGGLFHILCTAFYYHTTGVLVFFPPDEPIYLNAVTLDQQGSFFNFDDIMKIAPNNAVDLLFAPGTSNFNIPLLIEGQNVLNKQSTQSIISKTLSFTKALYWFVQQQTHGLTPSDRNPAGPLAAILRLQQNFSSFPNFRPPWFTQQAYENLAKGAQARSANLLSDQMMADTKKVSPFGLRIPLQFHSSPFHIDLPTNNVASIMICETIHPSGVPSSANLLVTTLGGNWLLNKNMYQTHAFLRVDFEQMGNFDNKLQQLCRTFLLLTVTNPVNRNSLLYPPSTRLFNQTSLDYTTDYHS